MHYTAHCAKAEKDGATPNLSKVSGGRNGSLQTFAANFTSLRNTKRETETETASIGGGKKARHLHILYILCTI